ncbi:UNVERIFIED_CONTAM: hypothetical protein HDU68_004161 [Siphonaria sp. JEL0065]|nr:hypothetical protein HDU68_004161 [Siphonaria sp. JEL0065]
MKPILFSLVFTALTVLAHPQPESDVVQRREPNCLADIITSRGLERRDMERRASWSYEGETSDDNWEKFSTTCQAGKYQSPINFEGTELIIKEKPTLFWSNLSKPFEFLNNGHTVQLQLKQSSPELISLQPNGLNYTVQQVHFHSPSEHHIEEKYFPIEAHFVHATPEGKLNVIGIIFQIGDENPWLKQFVDNIPQKENSTTTVSSLDMSSIISFLKDTSFYSYSGSLTTPPCTESVLWLVATKHQTISQAQLDKFTKVMPFNARTTQPNKSQNKNETDHAPEKNATDTGHGDTTSKSSSDGHHATKTESIHRTSTTAAVYQSSTVKSLLQSSATKTSVAVTAFSLLLAFYLF